MCTTAANAHLSGIQPLRIGQLQLPHNLLMAPMAGYTDVPFRQMWRQRPALAFTFMIQAIPLTMGCPATLSLLDRSNTENDLGIQLCGRDPATIVKAAQVAIERGFVLVDLNCGCPVKKIVRKGAGAALLREPKRIAQIVKVLKKELSVPVTIKIRTGWDHSSRNALTVGQLAQDAGADAIIIHGRTREQMYSGPNDLTIIAALKQTLQIPVIGNGGLFSPKDVHTIFEQTGCDGVMLARGALGHPWIFQDILDYFAGRAVPAQRSWEVTRAALCEHLDYLMAYYPVREALLKIRKINNWYLKGFPGCKRLRQALNSIRSRQEFLEHLGLQP